MFCDEFIDEVESYGIWSDGGNEDGRVEGGYQAVPTIDIHMNQIGLDKEWLYLLDYYVRPLQKLVFMGYGESPPYGTTNFIVRYRPDEQPSLQPHHDVSTYSINMALNERGVDFQVEHSH